MVQLGVSTSIGYFTDTIVDNYIEKAYKWAAATKKWPFTEGRVSTTYVSGQEEWVYPEGWKPDSIRMLQVGGKRFQKVNFYKYQGFREDFTSDTREIFTDFGGLYYINPKADASGTIVLYGQYTPILDVTDTTAETVFSGPAEEGNEAIVEEVLSYALRKEKKYNESAAHHENAVRVLTEIWDRIKDEQFGYQDTAGDGMFKRFDVLVGGFDDTIKRDQWF